jgi:hypothetical protein
VEQLTASQRDALWTAENRKAAAERALAKVQKIIERRRRTKTRYNHQEYLDYQQRAANDRPW